MRVGVVEELLEGRERLVRRDDAIGLRRHGDLVPEVQARRALPLLVLAADAEDVLGGALALNCGCDLCRERVLGILSQEVSFSECKLA